MTDQNDFVRVNHGPGGAGDTWAWDRLCDVLQKWAEEPLPDEPEEGWASRDLTRNHPREALAARLLDALGLPVDVALPLAREEVDRLRDALACILPYAESPDFDNGPPEDPENTYRDAMAKAQAALRGGK